MPVASKSPPDYFGGISSKEKFSEKIFEENILIKIQPKLSFKFFVNLWLIQKLFWNVS